MTKKLLSLGVGALLFGASVLTMAVTAEPGQVLMIYTAEPGSPSAERLRLLGSWAADRHAAVPER